MTDRKTQYKINLIYEIIGDNHGMYDYILEQLNSFGYSFHYSNISDALLKNQSYIDLILFHYLKPTDDQREYINLL